MGGEAGVTSAPGAGSLFWFTAWFGTAGAPAVPPAQAMLAGRRALVVDDLAEAREALSHGLGKLGLEVDAVSSGGAALTRALAAAAAGRPYGVVLIDGSMAPLDGIETQRRLRARIGAAMPPCILLSSHDDAAMWRQAREVHFDAVLVKPVTTTALNDALMRALQGEGATDLAMPAAAAGHECAALMRGLHSGQRVLLAEDNLVNQEVAGELLRSLGLVVETADNGQRAVELASSRHYDLVLMDVQMPVMDGIAASIALRERVGDALPIVAMTANAFSEDRAACLRAGMNDHVAKPVDPDHLCATLLRWLPPRGGTLPASAPARHANPRSEPTPLLEKLALVPGLDLECALRNTGGVVAVLERVLRTFVRVYERGEPDLLRPPRGDDLLRLRQTCHSLRGSCGSIGATDLQRALESLEASLSAPGPPIEAPARQAALQLHRDLQALVARLELELRPDSRVDSLVGGDGGEGLQRRASGGR